MCTLRMISEKHKLFELTQQELSMSLEREKDLVPRHVKDAKNNIKNNMGLSLLSFV